MTWHIENEGRKYQAYAGICQNENNAMSTEGKHIEEYRRRRHQASAPSVTRITGNITSSNMKAKCYDAIATKTYNALPAACLWGYLWLEDGCAASGLN